MIENLTREQYDTVLRQDFVTFTARCFHDLKGKPLLATLLPRVARWGQACRRVTEGRRNRSSALGKTFRSGGTVSSNPSSSSGESSTNRSSPADCLRSHKFCRRRQSRGASSSGLAVRGFPLRRTQRCEPPAIEAQVILSLPEIFPFTGAYPAGLFISDHGGNRQPDITVPIIAPFRCGYTSPAHCGAKAHGYSLSQGPRTKET